MLRGQKVVGCARSEQAISELANKHEGSFFAALDITNSAEVDAWVSHAIKEYGAPEFVINNAGVCNQLGNLWEVNKEDFQRVLDVNVSGTFNVIKAFVPHMIEAGRGIIVNMSSGWGRSVDAGVAPYCSSKWAIEGLTKAMALELPDGVAAVALNPGIIDTEMLQSVFGKDNGYPSATQWAQTAADYITNINTSQNGQSLTVP